MEVAIHVWVREGGHELRLIFLFEAHLGVVLRRVGSVDVFVKKAFDHGLLNLLEVVESGLLLLLCGLHV